MSLVTWEMIASAGYNFKVGVPEAHAKHIVHHLALKSVVGTLRTKIAQHFLIENYEILETS
jgi:hypothetical protein